MAHKILGVLAIGLPRSHSTEEYSVVMQLPSFRKGRVLDEATDRLASGNIPGMSRGP
jgi:hypothetical protein